MTYRWRDFKAAFLNVTPTFPRISYDQRANALYVYLRQGKIQQTVALGYGVYVDEDADGNAVGVEILEFPFGTRESWSGRP